MDFHFGGQNTSLIEDEAGGFGLWTGGLDLHGSTQPDPAGLARFCFPTSPLLLLLSSLVSGSRAPAASYYLISWQNNFYALSLFLQNVFSHYLNVDAS